ncbi:putative DNA mismatch repair protein Mlh3 [Lupinus albus]|uniref:Putative DNA mismatch repair protein Mlh3 n=1 Tax=Lupinus albus TaxID=3870 RepID=A0A6A4PB10_LUPAL|nr:putative DNA mismatch repair protein Mlh3 [Lupinus albus]
MASIIKPLPKSLRSSVRSGIFFFDSTRVVEELVFNSLDARATKVFVFVNIGTCYVKVVDNGGGITRDGLELAGERYGTLHCTFHYLFIFMVDACAFMLFFLRS